MGTVQRIATGLFICCSLLFGVLGIILVITSPTNDNSTLSKVFVANVFVLLPSFALSVASKYLMADNPHD
jgi:hypothetical protein